MNGCNRLRIVYIGGAGRSGTTLVERMVSQLDGVFGVGELTFLWERGLTRNELCGCGSPFLACEFWRTVLKDAFGGMDSVPTREAIELRTRVCRLSRIPQLHLRAIKSMRYRNVVKRYNEIMTSVVNSIAKLSGSMTIVDSSKYPSEAMLWQLASEIETSIVHVVRHPIAVAYAWRKRKVRPEIHWNRELFPKYHWAKTTAAWVLFNQAFESMDGGSGRYARIRYEDVAVQPTEAIRGVLDALKFRSADLSFIRDGGLHLKPNHTISGNTIRFESGFVDVSLDEEWKMAMPWFPAWAISVLTRRQMRRYGYMQSHTSQVQVMSNSKSLAPDDPT